MAYKRCACFGVPFSSDVVASLVYLRANISDSSFFFVFVCLLLRQSLYNFFFLFASIYIYIFFFFFLFFLSMVAENGLEHAQVNIIPNSFFLFTLIEASVLYFFFPSILSLAKSGPLNCWALQKSGQVRNKGKKNPEGS